VGFIIFSKKLVERKEVLKSFVEVAYNIGARFDIQESNLSLDERKQMDIDFILSKNNDDVNEYFTFGIHSEDEVRKTSELLDLKIGKYYGIAGTDHDKFPFLMYLIGKEYLKLNPEHILSANGDTFFTKVDFDKMEQRNGYFNEWCYQDLPWQNEST